MTEAGERVNVLVVDDRPSNLRSLEAALARPDYNIVLARSGPEALGHILRNEFAVILLDVAMPGMDGFETAKVIKQREHSKLIPIIFITASVYDMQHVFRGYTVGAVDYLRKPADTYQVRAKVAVFVELYRARKKIERQASLLSEAEQAQRRLLRESLETALRQSEALSEHTFDHAPTGIGHATPEGAWLRVNPKLCDVLGTKREGLIGRSVADIVEGEERRRLVEALERLAAGEKVPYREEHRLATADGRDAWGRIVISTLHESGRVVRLIVVIEDVTALKKAEHERSALIGRLEQSIRVRDDFLSIAAHELKTPLTPLRLQTSSLLRRMRTGGPVPRLVERLERIDASAARLEGLVERLLDFSRLSVGDLPLELGDVDLRAVVANVIERLGDEVRRSGSEVRLHAPGPVEGTWDRLRLEQVVANLVSNAVKYGNGAPIDVTIEAEDGHVRVRVEDRGIGIPAGEQERIFERFDRLSPVRHYGGFGIGLWIAREIIEAHGGRITVSSRPGEGSVFTVELPRSAELKARERRLRAA